MPRGADVSGVATWKPLPVGAKYVDTDGASAGITKVKVYPDPANGQILVKGKGANLGTPVLPAILPITAQMVNLDNGSCWETPFTTTRANDATKVVAAQ